MHRVMESSIGCSSPSPSGAVSVSSPEGPTEELRSLKRESSSVSAPMVDDRGGGGAGTEEFEDDNDDDWCNSTGGGGICGDGKMLAFGWGINC